MSKQEYKIICRECNGENTIRSDERICATFRVFPCGSDELDYDGSSEKVYGSNIEGYFCEDCRNDFSESEVIEMIYTVYPHNIVRRAGEE
jgi:protein-arginine kinase activator protein McsA